MRQYFRFHSLNLVTYLLSLSILAGFVHGAFAAGSVTLDGSLNPAKTGPVAGGTVNGIPTTYLISPDLGQVRGNNLFQSFSSFSIGTGESATFTSPAGISNIISRVTGGTPSSIDGLIRSVNMDGTGLGNANLFLLNPSGVMFGPNASLDIGGSFHVSTADYLKFSNGDVFYVNPLSTSVLSVAAPEAFGFLSANPSSITLDQSVLQVPPGQTLSIIGGNILLDNNRDNLGSAYYDPTFTDNPNGIGPKFYMLSAPGGTINLISVASPGEVNLKLPDLGIGSFAQLGEIRLLNGANLNADSDILLSGPAGSIIIRGGDLLFQNLGFADFSLPLAVAGIDASGNPPGFVDIKGSSLHLDNASISVFNTGEVDHPGTACKLDFSGNLLITNGSWIDASNFGGGSGGDISITAGNITLGDDDPASSLYADSGFYGYISSSTFGSRQDGNISITAANLVVQNGFFITTATLGEGDAGNISVHADTVKFLDQGNMASNAFGSGKGGIVEIVASDVLISAKNAPAVINSFQITGVGAQTSSASHGGKIEITADNLQILDGGKISSVLFGSEQEAHGADVEINAKNMTISGFYADSNLSPKPYALSAVDGRVIGSDATGTGGNITVTTDSLKLDNGGVIRTGLFSDAPGNAGNITVNAGNIDISSRGQINSDSFRGTGNSGDMVINAKTLTITGAANVPRPGPLDFDFAGLSTTTNSGLGGNIRITLTSDLLVTGRGSISADTQGTGLGGAVTVSAQNVNLTDGGKISSASTGTGNAGDINVMTADSLLMRNSSITTEASIDADGGNITINSPYKVSLTDSRITASVGGGPETTGGNIAIDPHFVIMNKSQIVANAYQGTGGNIKIVTDTFIPDPQSVVDASSALGISGTVDIQAPINNVSGFISPLPTDFVNASALLKERCIARTRGGKYSSFVVGGRDGLPIEPGNFLPGLVY